MKRIISFLIIAFSLCGMMFADGFFTTRFFEFKLNIPVNVSNNAFAVKDILKKELVIDLNKIADDVPGSGFVGIFSTNPNMQMNLSAGPVKVGLETGVDVYAKLDISKSLFDFIGKGNSGLEKIDVNGNIFVDSFQYTQANVGIKFKRFSINVTPGLFVPLAATNGSKISAVFSNDEDTGSVSLNAKVLTDAYELTDFQKLAKEFNQQEIFNALKNSIGFDVAGGFTMPLSKQLTVSGSARIPVVPATLRAKQSISVGLDYNANIIELASGSKGNTSAPAPKVEFGEVEAAEYKVCRPLFMMGYVDFYPLFGINLLSLRGGAGVGVRHPFASDAVRYFNYYAGATVNLIDILKVTASISYMEKIFKNQIELSVNIRLIELDIGASLQSANFLKSWQGAGFGAYVNLAIGF